MAIDLPRWLRPPLRLWYCRIKKVHDWTKMSWDMPYGFKVCSLCDKVIEKGDAA